MPSEGTWPYRHQLRVRYHECDMQQVVFNAHYLTWCDEAMTGFLRHATGLDLDVVDWMLVRIELDWVGSATFDDVVEISVGVRRWGTTSFTTAFEGGVGDRPVFRAEITYVCVRPGTTEKMAVPDDVKAAMGMAP